MMAHNKKNLAGQKFGRLTVIKEYGRAHRKVVWLCKCDCGKETQVVSSQLLQNHTKSCGCLVSEISRATGLKNKGRNNPHGICRKRPGDCASEHPLYRIRRQFIYRCYKSNDKDFKNYGARGIKVCPEWLKSPWPFLCWALLSGWEPGLQIDRINNDGPYSPSNCRFTTVRINTNNRRTTKMINFLGVISPLAELVEKSGLKYVTVHARIFRYGWTPERALTEPAAIYA